MEDVDNGVAEVDHIVVSWRTNNGGLALPSGVKQGDNIWIGRHDGSGNL